MNSIKILPSLFITAVCVFQGYSANPVIVVTSDDDFNVQMINADANEILNVFYFTSMAEYHSEVINNLISSYPTINVFNVEVLSTCETTGTDLGIDIHSLPTVMFRKFGRTIRTLIYPELDELQTKISVDINLVKEQVEIVRDIADCNGKIWKLESELADKSGKLVITYIVNNIREEDTLRLRINKMTILEKSEIIVFRKRLDFDKCRKEIYLFYARADFVKQTFPKIRFRKFRKNKHLLIGYNEEYFYRLFLEYKSMDEAEISSQLFKENIFNNTGRAVNSVYYTVNCEDLNSQIKKADENNELIILYIVAYTNEFGDSYIDLQARNNPTVKFIRICKSDCNAVSEDYADKAKGFARIVSYPTMIVRAFNANKSWIENLDTIKLNKKIKKYKGATTDPDARSTLKKMTSKLFPGL